MSKQIYAISWSHHKIPIDFRDKLALSKEEIKQCIDYSDRNQIIELAILSTCNRIEFYALAVDEADVFTFIKDLYFNVLKRNITWGQSTPEIYSDIEVIQHLFRVASGMDSMVLGEIQILSQVKVAQQILMQNLPDADVLGKLFDDALYCSEAVRNSTPLFMGSTSISELAVQTVQQIFDNLAKRTILIVGAGETAELTAHLFKSVGINKIYIANRSEKHGRALAESLSANYIKMNHMNNILIKCDAMVTATDARDYLIKRDQIENIMNKRTKELLLIDISTPRNMEPSIHEIGNVSLYDLDHLDAIASNNRRKIKETLVISEIIIRKHSQKLLEWIQLKTLKETEPELA